MPKDITVIKAPRIKGYGNSLPVKGAVLIPELYSTVFLAGKTYSGKSVVINHLVKNTIDKRTTVLLFCSTANIDKNYIDLQAWLTRKDIKCVVFNSLIDDDTGENMLDAFLKNIEGEQAVEEPEVEIKNDPKPCHCIFENQEEIQLETKPRKIVYKDSVPEYVIILDDLNKDELRSYCILNLVKKNRHYKARVFISTQFIHGLTPSTWANIWYLYIFGGFSRENMKLVYGRVNTSLTFDNFIALYQEITSKKFAFMNLNIRTGETRRNFEEILKI